jgi:hypothetical protein
MQPIYYPQLTTDCKNQKYMTIHLESFYMTKQPKTSIDTSELKVIGAGFGRTGTLSIKAALEELGFGPCYHMNDRASFAGRKRWQRLRPIIIQRALIAAIIMLPLFFILSRLRTTITQR